jgi:hypothetical protein
MSPVNKAEKINIFILFVFFTVNFVFTVSLNN